MAQVAKVDKSLCIACGSCISSCSDCFVWGEDGKAQFKESSEVSSCNLQEIADNCPVMAIEVTEA